MEQLKSLLNIQMKAASVTEFLRQIFPALPRFVTRLR